MRAGRIVMVIVAALATIVGFGALAAGSALIVVHATQRDGAGFYTSPTTQLQTATHAVMTRVDLGGPGGPWQLERPLGTVRVDATGTGPGPVFIGIGPAEEVERWLAGSAYERVTRVDYRPFEVESELVQGTDGTLAEPARQAFWAASAAGVGRQSLTWPSERGQWALVVSNADGRPRVQVDVTVAAATDALLPIGLVIGLLGLFLLAGAVVALLLAVQAVPAEPTAAAAGRPGAYPARLDARLSPDLSRWLWLVKWILAIPHAIVLALLWIAVAPLTLLAGFAILFTGRYPRSIFDFNVGVMRWTWRVSYYTFSALGTDRYPPFSLRPDPGFPADFTVDYPNRLSRGLVLVKWWLLAVPHYLIVGVFTAGWLGWHGEQWQLAAGGGLIGLLVLIAGIVLLMTGTYPRPLFDFVMGMNRWCYRVLAYAALMRDEYPPFRLDTGGTDPGTVPARPATPPPPDIAAELVGAGPRGGVA